MTDPWDEPNEVAAPAATPAPAPAPINQTAVDPWDEPASSADTPPPPQPNMGPSKALFENNFRTAHGPIPGKDTNTTSQTIPGEVPKSLSLEEEKKKPFDVYDAIQSGWGMSIQGLMTNGKLPAVMPEDAPMFYRIASGAAQMAGDIPAMVTGAILGGAAGSEIPVAGTAAGAAGGAFALPSAWRKVLIDHYQKGDITDFKDFYTRASSTLLEAMKGFTIGVATAGTGAVGAAAGEQIAGRVANTMLQSTVKTTAQLASEVTAMVSVGKAMEGQVPHAQDFFDAAFLVGGFHGITAGLSKVGSSESKAAPLQNKMMQIYADTGLRPDQIAMHAMDEPTIKQDLLSDNVDFPRAYKGIVDGHLPQTGEPIPTDSTLVKNEGGMFGDHGEPAPDAEIKNIDIPPPAKEPVLKEGEEKTPLQLAHETIRSKIIGKESEQSQLGKLFSAPMRLIKGVDNLGEKMVLAHMNDTLIPSIEDAFKSRGKEFYQNRVDRLNPLGIDPAAYSLGRLAVDYRGKTDYVIQKGTLDFHTLEKNGPGLAETLSEVNSTVDEFVNYSVSKRALELSERFADKTKEEVNAKIGLDLDAAKVVVDNADRNFQRINTKLTQFQNRNLDYFAESGVISKEGSETIQDLNKNYVPFSRIIEDTENPMKRSSKNPIKSFKGSESAIGDPIQSIIDNTDMMFKLAEQNRAVNTFVENELAKVKRGEDSLITKVPTPMKGITIGSEELAKAFHKEGFTDVTPEALTIFRPIDKDLAENQFSRRVDGKIEVYETDPALATALKNINMSSPTLATWQKLLAPFATISRLGLTTDLGFVARHTSRNQLVAATFAENGKLPITADQQGAINLAKRLPFGLMIEGLGHIIKKDDVYYDHIKSGGSRSAYIDLNKNYIDNNVWQLSKETGLMDKTWNMIKNPIDSLHAIATLGDNATALAQYKRVLGDRTGFAATVEAGMSAREVIPDTQRMGLKMQASNIITAFQNMQIQGMDKVLRVAQENPGKLAASALTFITLPSVLLWAANKDDKRVQDLPNYVKDLNWIVATDKWEQTDSIPPGTPEHMLRTGSDGKVYINNGIIFKFPKPFELGVLFGSFSERILDEFFTDKSEAFKGFADELMHGALPSMLPSGLAAPLETYSNKSLFTGNAIVPESVMGEVPEYRYTDYTSDTAKAISRMVAKVPALQFRNEIAPPMIDNAIRSWSGTAGQYALQLLDKGLQAAGQAEVKVKPDWTLADIPVIKSFIVRNPSSGFQSIQDFYEDYGKASMVSNTITGEGKRGNAEEVNRLMTDPAYSQHLLKLQGIHESIANEQKAVMLIYRNPVMSGSDKRQLIDGLYFQMNESAKLGNKMMDDFKKNMIDNGTNGGTQ